LVDRFVFYCEQTKKKTLSGRGLGETEKSAASINLVDHFVLIVNKKKALSWRRLGKTEISAAFMYKIL